jgi:DNA primase
LALEHFLDRHAEVTRCLVCTDNDEAGESAAAKIAELPGITAERVLPGDMKDWNDLLQALLKAERTQNKARRTPCL